MVLPQRSTPFSALAKPTGAVCNLDCTYCFFLSKELLYDDDSRGMTAVGLETYLANLLNSQPDGPVEVAWQGGEPTLRGLPFFRRVVRLVEQLRRPGQQVRHALQTNATLLDDDWCEFLAENSFLVGVSIDGPARLHDAYRVNKAGRGTHALVQRGWDRLQKHGVDINVLCTVHAANESHPIEVYRYFRDILYAHYLQFIPIVERAQTIDLPLAENGWRAGSRGKRTVLYRQHGDQVTSRSANPLSYGRFLIEIFDEWVSHDVGQVFVQDFDVALGNILGHHTLCVHAPECGTAIAVEHNGDVYSCDHYVEPGFQLGNVANASLQAMVTSPAQRSFGRAKLDTLPRQCVECPVRWACHGGCPKDRFATTSAGEQGLNHLCPGYLAFFTHIQPDTERMARLLQAGRPAADVMRA